MGGMGQDEDRLWVDSSWGHRLAECFSHLQREVISDGEVLPPEELCHSHSHRYFTLFS